MVLIYRGKVKSLQDQIEENKDTLNQRYKEVLGEDYCKKIEGKAERLLVPECFLNSIDELNEFTSETFPENTPSKILMLTDSDITLDNKGRIKEKDARMSFGFYVSEESFKGSGSSQITDKIIASYIHEYDHFIYGVLQKQPLYLVRNTLLDELGSRPIDLESLTKFILDVEKEDTNEKEKKRKLMLATNAYALESMWEDATRILDKLILESIGIKAPLPFRGEKREYGFHVLQDPYMTIGIPSGGDQFLGLSDKEVVHRVINWVDYMNPVSVGDNEFYNNFFDSLKGLKFTSLPLTQLKKENEKELKRHKRTKTYKKTQELKKKMKKREGRRK